ncbi:MAG: GxxExxY protein [Chloroflexota bacterium]
MAEIIHKDLSYAVVGAAMEVHRLLGSGFLEAVYETALAYELQLRGIGFERQKRLSVSYKGQFVGEYIADMVVEDQIILELKAVSAISPSHEAQAHHYLAATGKKLALILNFGCESLQQKRIVR